MCRIVYFINGGNEILYIPENMLDFNRINHTRLNLAHLDGHMFSHMVFLPEKLINDYLEWLVDGMYRKVSCFHSRYIKNLGIKISESTVYNEEQKNARLKLVERYKNKATLLGLKTYANSK